jgi:flagellum-specific peptidoglycan hydrolase FlgJ
MGLPSNWHRFWLLKATGLNPGFHKTMMFVQASLLILLLVSSRKEEMEQPYVNSYIESYKYMAIDEMVRSGIPASITMAQAILESNAGASRLARASNNHFGIKCKYYWEGEEYFLPDDDRDENGNLIPSCFRKYKDVQSSYTDHSDFLMMTDHYRPLFSYDKTEYEKWANGLELCGYATGANYGEKLIRIIELYDLQELDYYTIEYMDASELSDQYREITILD